MAPRHTRARAWGTLPSRSPPNDGARMSTAILCIALLAILVFGLGFAVSIVRGRTDIVYGHPDDPTNFLHKIVRAHGNTVEYAGTDRSTPIGRTTDSRNPCVARRLRWNTDLTTRAHSIAVSE